MKNCQKRNAVLDEKLWFRRDLFSRDCDKGDDASLMTVNEIINGKVSGNFFHMLWFMLFQLIPVCVCEPQYPCYFKLKICHFFQVLFKEKSSRLLAIIGSAFLFSMWLF